MKHEKKCGFSYDKNMANFEGFHYIISSSINLPFLKSGNLPIQVPQMRPPMVAVNAAKHCGHNTTFAKLIF